MVRKPTECHGQSTSLFVFIKNLRDVIKSLGINGQNWLFLCRLLLHFTRRFAELHPSNKDLEAGAACRQRGADMWVNVQGRQSTRSQREERQEREQRWFAGLFLKELIQKITKRERHQIRGKHIQSGKIEQYSDEEMYCEFHVYIHTRLTLRN